MAAWAMGVAGKARAGAGAAAAGLPGAGIDLVHLCANCPGLIT